MFFGLNVCVKVLLVPLSMALPAAFLSEDQFTCSICLEVFTDPVSTPCGHSFCQSCISAYWDRGGAKSFQCPLCKENFRKRPELHINRTLKEITEHFKQVVNSGGGGAAADFGTDLQPQPEGQMMPEGVFAEMMGRFQQLPSLGRDVQNQNLPPPPYSPPRRYTLSVPGDSSPSMPLCPLHLKGLDFFCRSDNSCVCSVCVEAGGHRGHQLIPAKREWHLKKSQMGIAEVELKDLIVQREIKVKEIQNSLRDIRAAAEREANGAVSVFSRLISSAERCQADILEVIEMSRRAAEHRAQALLKELEEEISQLRRRSDTLSQLAQSEDCIHFLQTFPKVSTLPHVKDRSDASATSELTTGLIVKTVTQMLDCFQEEMLKLPQLCQQSSTDQSVPRNNPRIRRVQEYAADVTLDPSTAHPRLVVSVDGKQVCCGDRHQPVPDNPERFDRVVCVLARQGFSSGRHYWEVEVGGKTDWDLGVASRSIVRKGKITVSPSHGYWFLSLRDQTDYAFRTEPSTGLSLALRPSRIGIYVDCDKGLVSFYNVEAKVLIYTFTDSFPDIVHPFFSPCTNKSGRNEAPLIVCPVSTTE